MIPRDINRTPVLPPGTYSAHRVLREVICAIEVDERRLDMGRWVTLLKGRRMGEHSHYISTPPCGTVACVSGWIGVITHQTLDTHNIMYPFSSMSRFTGAKTLALLGLTVAAATPRQCEAGRALERIFCEDEGSLPSTAVVLQQLRDYCVEYRGLLSHLKVVVR